MVGRVAGDSLFEVSGVTVVFSMVGDDNKDCVVIVVVVCNTVCACIATLCVCAEVLGCIFSVAKSVFATKHEKMI